MDLTKHLQEFKEAIDTAGLDKIVEILKDAKENGKTVYTFGNGGSHSTASHFACDLLKACYIKAICISDLVPMTYAYMNDYGQSVMFSKIFNRLKDDNCIIIAFSCSGESSNVIDMLIMEFSKIIRILFTGTTGGHAAQNADLTIYVKNDNIRIQESAHLAYCHAIIEELLDGEV